MSFLLYTLLTLFIIISLLLILVVLIQKGRGGGLANAFGGGGGGNTAFGAKTGDVLTWVTSVMFGVFLVLAIALNLLANNQSQSYKPRGAVAPAAPISQQLPADPGTSGTTAATDTRTPAQRNLPAQNTGSTDSGAAKPAPAGGSPTPVTPAPGQK